MGNADLTDTQRRWRCVMEVTLKDGRVLRHQTMAAKGSFENPLTPKEENEKALDLFAPVLGRRAVTRGGCPRPSPLSPTSPLGRGCVH